MTKIKCFIGGVVQEKMGHDEVGEVSWGFLLLGTPFGFPLNAIKPCEPLIGRGFISCNLTGDPGSCREGSPPAYLGPSETDKPDS